MTDDENKEDDSLELSAGCTPEGGAQGKVRIGGLQRLFAFISPHRAGRAELTVSLARSASQKLAEGKNLTGPEAAIVAQTLRNEIETLRRRLEIEERAEEAFPLVQRQLPSAAANEPDADWLRRFWADAELVGGEQMQELYARILAGETARNGSFSRQTLAVIRDLDTEAAQLFGLARNFVCEEFLPRDKDFERYLADRGLDFGAMMRLGDAGLLRPHGTVNYGISKGNVKVLRHGGRLIRCEALADVRLDCYPLAEAAIELLPVAVFTFDDDYFRRLLQWLMRHSLTVAWAVAPGVGAVEPEAVKDLEWNSVERDTRKTGA